MAPQPEIHHDIYDAVDPKHFKDSQKGKLALVIGISQVSKLTEGSARNIGQGVALNFAKAGANIASFDILDTSETVSLAKEEGVNAKGWQLDATDEQAVSKAIDEVEETLGPIDILVNLTGITGSRPIFMEHIGNFWRTMEVNTKSVRTPIHVNLALDFHPKSPSLDEGAWKGYYYQCCFESRDYRLCWISSVRR
jgi:NAD(P)-dependent dehydrogenase (short-subunit alcohol dehydrogenase family)